MIPITQAMDNTLNATEIRDAILETLLLDHEKIFNDIAQFVSPRDAIPLQTFHKEIVANILLDATPRLWPYKLTISEVWDYYVVVMQDIGYIFEDDRVIGHKMESNQ